MKIIDVSLIAIAALTLSCSDSKKIQEEATVDKETATSQLQMAAATVVLEAPEPEIFYITANSGLSLRKASNLRSKKLLTIPYGSQVQLLSRPTHTDLTIDGKSGAMIEVDYQGARGFIFNGYASKLAPPHDDESVTAYAKRVASVVPNVKVSQLENPKGKAYGMTTSLELPAKSWDEAYTLSRKLFHLPASISLRKVARTADHKVVNAKKIKASLKDELSVIKDNDGSITQVNYEYMLRDYSRSVIISKTNTGFLIKEIEVAK